ncbi:MAG: sigma-70 family RNA polymerase sigma factor [Anaerolineales bacterium]|jgi:RNA polymerase sigma-70 factor (ECF subfamily)
MSSRDVSWLQAARSRDRQVLAEIYDQLSPELFRYAYRLLGESNAAEDIVSEAFVRFLQALEAGGGPQDNLRAYLYRIAHNLAMDTHRRDAPVEREDVVNLETMPASDNPAMQAEERISQAQARQLIWRLTPDQRQVILLKFFQGLGNDEVAAALDKPVGAVKALQHRALRSLRRMLQQEHGWGVEGDR